MSSRMAASSRALNVTLRSVLMMLDTAVDGKRKENGKGIQRTTRTRGRNGEEQLQGGVALLNDLAKGGAERDQTQAQH
jgi:hypothetical protein